MTGKIFEVRRTGKVIPITDAFRNDDVWVLPNGNLLFTTGNGVREINRKKEVIFEYNSSSEIFACQRLANGNTFISECTAGRLLEVEPGGKVAKEIRLLPEGISGGHFFSRNARKLDNGNYLVAHYGLSVVREYDPNGKVIKEIPAEGGPHSVVRLENGNTLISIADRDNNRPGVIEVNMAGEKVWEIWAGDLSGISLKFIAGIQRLSNGNTILCNWLGHGNLGKSPHLIEVTPDKKVVWIFSDHNIIRTISTVHVMDSWSIPAK